MKNLIKKILKESDFEWANQLDPLQSFEDYFYGNYKMNVSQIKQGYPAKFIKRDIKWWRNWIHEVEMAHANFLDDVNEINDMVHDLVNPADGSKKYFLLADDVYNYFSPSRALGGRNYLQDMAGEIKTAYEVLGSYSEDNNLTILETLNIFKQWLDKMESEGKPLHNN